MEKYIVALDQGTTSSRAVAFDHDVNKVASAQKEFTQYYPKPGWVEHDADELFSSALSVLKETVESVRGRGGSVAAVGITNQRETVVMWDKKTGRPMHRAIVWQCRRTARFVDSLVKSGAGDSIRAKTGLLPDAYFSATKIKWLLDNVPGARERAEAGEILAGTVDSFLIWKLSGGKAHVTDVTNASRTMLFNIHTLDWDSDLLSMMGIPRRILPEVKDSSAVYAMTSESVCGFESPIASAAGDQQAALFGQCCFKAGDVKSTYGTGCFLLMNTGERIVESKRRLLSTIALGMNGKTTYALEGSVFMGGATIKWLRDELGVIQTAHECDILAESVPDSGGAVLVPAFTGLGAPYWDSYARGALVGITRGTGKAHICRATLEAIAFQVRDALECMREDLGSGIRAIKVDGGACVSDLMMQFQADISRVEVARPRNIETTVTGAAFLAGLAVGFWRDQNELEGRWQVEKIFSPRMERETSETLLARWKRAVERAERWARD